MLLSVSASFAQNYTVAQIEATHQCSCLEDEYDAMRLCSDQVVEDAQE